ncbi:leucine-rich repeat receptor-like protein kinase PXC1 [Aristolochia californica]|uniref:leucine-rich repeat receptor-like protein kinase PXC1 n=1 Tax=Aristolochia californica TaxID=171875 RepID=UPI0035E04C9D
MGTASFFCSMIWFFLSVSSSAPTKASDTEALLRFRLQTDAHGALAANWTAGGSPCTAPWLGVGCTNDRVTSLHLPSIDIRGALDALASLDQLRLLDLHDNRLNGSLLPLTKCSNLKLLYLSGNDLSGEIPDEFAQLKRLLRLDLSDNNLSGPIPAGISKLSRLVTLRLRNNALSGKLPDFSASMPGLREFNVSDNELFGKVPDGLRRKFGDGSVSGNAGLCGSSPFPICSFIDSLSLPPSDPDVVPSNPSSMPGSAIGVGGHRKESDKRKALSTGAIIAIVVADVVVLLVLVSFLLACFCGRYSGANEEDGMEKRKKSSGSDISSTGKMVVPGVAGDENYDREEQQRSKLVFFEGRKQFELEDLLKASAEMLGKGSLGTVYRAVLEDGCTVAVKRLKDANPCPRKDFESYMDLIGKLRHPNIVRLRAYYYAKEEKLLVYEYHPNGSLFSLLHGNRGPGRTPLDWTTRISLVLGAARGLARIHDEYGATKIPHGNIRSSNVLLDKNGIACIADFGLALLLNPAQVVARQGGYRAPEQAESKNISQEADVYAFGVVLLEMVTGRAPLQHPPRMMTSAGEEEEELPRWVRAKVKEEWTAEVFDAELLRYKNIEEELTAMLQLGLACVAEAPEERPAMWEVMKMIEEIRVENSPLGEDLYESRTSLSPSIAATEDEF